MNQRQDVHSAHRGPRRFVEQRWLIDNVIRANGIDWDQPRLGSLQAAMGAEATGDIAAIRGRVQKLADIAPAFESVARRREAKALAAAELGQTVTAAENFYMAALYWASAQWPIDENNEQNLFYNCRKRECYARYAQLAAHRVEPVWVPLGDKALPGWLHLPSGREAARVPAIVAIPGMDGFKERTVSLYGDRWLNRGIAVLAIEGPGQYEAAVLGIHVGIDAWSAAGPAMFEWLAARPEIERDRIGIIGQSFGSLFATIACAGEPRYRACAVSATCLEPGCHTIFEEASPTFKSRFMYMSGFTDEPAFDRFCRTLTWEGHAEKIRAPYLCVAGSADQLSPLPHTERLMQTLAGPRQLVVYQDAVHSVGGAPSTHLGPFPATLLADWMSARLAGQPLSSERWDVDATGRVVSRPLA
jgi:dienelactone hydrolase